VVAEIETLRQLDFIAPGILQGNPDAVALYFGGPSGETVYYPNIDLANLVPPDFDVTQRPWYVAASPEQNTTRLAVWSALLDAAATDWSTVSHLIFDQVAVPRRSRWTSNRTASAPISDIQLNVGYAFVIDPGGHLIAMPAPGKAGIHRVATAGK
jgi:hypothetical protein